ncbi:MAG TPA: twin transmembrane helix small protein [Ramlibacter sp.]|nr:twin transmembrane helix small protein [Ramlibacter sp.]
MKYLVILAFVGIIGSLGSALFFMMRDGQGGKAKTSNMARALAWRVGLSILLFICILIAWKLGYIQPTGIPLTPK